MNSERGRHRGVPYRLVRRAGAERGLYQVHCTIHGDRLRATTGTPDVNTAHEQARAIIDHAVDGPEERPWTLRDAAEAALSLHWASARSRNTVELNVALVLRRFGHDTLVRDISMEDYIAFTQHLERTGCSDSTINKKTSTLRTILKTAHAAGKLDRVLALPHRREGKGRVRYLSDTEERALLHLLEQWGETMMRDYVIVAIDTGMRRGEMLGLEWRDVVLEADVPKVHLWETKSDAPRTIPLTRRAAAAFRRRAQDTPQEPRRGPFTALSPETIRRVWARAKEALGLSQDAQWVPHAMRHTCASRLVMAGFHLQRVREWMGHADIKTTLRYAHLAADALDDGARLLDARAPKPHLTAVPKQGM